jgi:hypothetical protein
VAKLVPSNTVLAVTRTAWPNTTSVSGAVFESTGPLTWLSIVMLEAVGVRQHVSAAGRDRAALHAHHHAQLQVPAW